MRNRTPVKQTVPAFDPVPRNPRHDGWTPERQRAFIRALAETGNVTRAAAAVKMAKEGAYQLRLAPNSKGFRRAWAKALDHGVQRLTDVAMERALEGVPVPVFHKGEQVGERRCYNDKLLMFILKHHMPHRYGGAPIGSGTQSPQLIASEADPAYQDDEDRLTAENFRSSVMTLAKMLTIWRTKLASAVDAEFAFDDETRNLLVAQCDAIEQVLPIGPEAWEDILRHHRKDGPAVERIPRITSVSLPGRFITGSETCDEREAVIADCKAQIKTLRMKCVAAASEKHWQAWKQDHGGIH